MDLKSGPVTIHVRQAPEAKTAIVAVSFKAKGDAAILNNLECAASYSFEDVDETAVLYALYLNCREKIFKNFTEESKSKIVNVCCSLHCGEMTIYANCDSSVTCVRKCIAGILHGLSPIKCRSLYKNVCRSIGAVPNDDGFEAACSGLESGLKAVHIFVGGKALGKASDDKTKIDEMLSIAVKKFEPEFGGKGKSRSVKVNDKMPDFAESHYMTKKGSPAGIVAGYMFLSGIPSLEVIDCKLSAHKSQETAISKLADKKELLVKQLEKMGNLSAPSHSLAFVAAGNKLLNVSDLVSLADEKFSAAGIATAATKL
jgi:hypothetical protein